jgi:hypothetical protein
VSCGRGKALAYCLLFFRRAQTQSSRLGGDHKCRADCVMMQCCFSLHMPSTKITSTIATPSGDPNIATII